MPDTETPQLGELGSTGLRQFSGYVREEFLTELQGQNKYEIFNEMRKNDPVVGAMLNAITSLMRQANWKVDRGEARNQKAERARDFLKSNIDDMYPDWESTLSDILTMVPFGHSLHEIVWKRREGHKNDPVRDSKFNDGRIGIGQLPIRQQETLKKWQFGDHGIPEAVKQNSIGSAIDKAIIPRDKFLNFKPKSARGNPEGSSALRSAYRPWYFKKRIQEIEAIGIERDLAGMPMAEVPPEYLDDDAPQDIKNSLDNIKEIVRNIRRDEQEGIVFPKQLHDEHGEDMFNLTLMSAGGERQFNINDIIKRYDQRIAMTTLADFILIGHESVGSFALANSKTSSFALALEAWLDVIQDKLNTKLVPKLFRMNDFDLDEKEMPKFQHSEIEGAELDQLGSFFKNLKTAGFDFSENDRLSDWLLQQADAPLTQEGNNSNSNSNSQANVQKATHGENNWVQWQNGSAHGKIDEIITDGCTTRGKGSQKVCAEEGNPAVVIEVYDDETGESQDEFVRHKMSTLNSWDGPSMEKQVDTIPTDEMANNAAQALDKYNDDELDNDDCGTRVGVERANQLENKEELSEEIINRMVSFFERHDGDQEINEGIDNKWEDCGYLTWQFWGGDAGFDWAKRKQKQFEQEE